jgi:hypothetical protein
MGRAVCKEVKAHAHALPPAFAAAYLKAWMHLFCLVLLVHGPHALDLPSTPVARATRLIAHSLFTLLMDLVNSASRPLSPEWPIQPTPTPRTPDSTLPPFPIGPRYSGGCG